MLTVGTLQKQDEQINDFNALLLIIRSILQSNSVNPIEIDQAHHGTFNEVLKEKSMLSNRKIKKLLTVELCSLGENKNFGLRHLICQIHTMDKLDIIRLILPEMNNYAQMYRPTIINFTYEVL